MRMGGNRRILRLLLCSASILCPILLASRAFAEEAQAPQESQTQPAPPIATADPVTEIGHPIDVSRAVAQQFGARGGGGGGGRHERPTECPTGSAAGQFQALIVLKKHASPQALWSSIVAIPQAPVDSLWSPYAKVELNVHPPSLARAETWRRRAGRGWSARKGASTRAIRRTAGRYGFPTRRANGGRKNADIRPQTTMQLLAGYCVGALYSRCCLP